ncbi:hypothetical protein Vafri_15925 [Volvox africanus]|uniref:Pherophorin domain-containing protein n=1 Tax=Volvox africanus TaxID=51714 RepID=A0A8J4BHA2_9CHLO|nr:hypothetical protein Vafri_15925 [Volvox africanus]
MTCPIYAFIHPARRLTSHLSWTRAAAEDVRALEVTSTALEGLHSSTAGLLLRSDVSFLAALSPQSPPPKPPPPMRSPPPSPSPFKSPPPIPRSSMYSPPPSPQPARLPPPPPLFSPPAKKANYNNDDGGASSSSSSLVMITPLMSPPSPPPSPRRRSPPPSPSPSKSPSINWNPSRISPSPSPPPPYKLNVGFPPPPPPPPPPCMVCISVVPLLGVLKVRELSQADCDHISDVIIQDMTDKASAVGAGIYQSDGPPSVDCSRRDDLMQVCFKFVSDEDGNKLQGYIHGMLEGWVKGLLGTCPTYFINVGGEGDDPFNAPSCLQDGFGFTCSPVTIRDCTTEPGATPFGVRRRLTKLPGYSSNTVMYCFEIVQVPVVYTNVSACLSVCGGIEQEDRR